MLRPTAKGSVLQTSYCVQSLPGHRLQIEVNQSLPIGVTVVTSRMTGVSGVSQDGLGPHAEKDLAQRAPLDALNSESRADIRLQPTNRVAATRAPAATTDAVWAVSRCLCAHLRGRT